MQDWPSGDRQIAAAIVAGDPAGLAAAYDRYAPALYAYCRSLLGEPADAADAVQDTFVVAASRLAGLRDPDRLRPWLYAVARNECHRRLRSRARAADLEEAGDVTDASADVSGAAERGELRALVRSAIGGLNPGEQEVIELSLRHELDGADLADALGVPLNQAHALASRARGQLERSLGALLVARTGREACPELDAMLAGWDGRLTILLRKRVSRHIEHCDVCGERKRRELSPAMLLSAFPVFILPAGLRRDVLQLVSDASHDAVGYRDYVARRAGPFSRPGFPVPIAAVSRARPRNRAVLYAAAAALVLLAGGGAVAVAMLRHGPGRIDAAAGGAPATPPGAISAQVTTPGVAPVPVSSRTGTPAAVPPGPAATTPAASPSPASPTPTRTPTPTPTRTPTPPPTKSPAPPTTPPGTLSESPSSVTLTQPPTGGPFTGSFTLTAVGGPVSFTITVPQGLTVSQASGSLTSGQTITITVGVNAGNPPPFSSSLTVSPGTVAVTILYPPSG